jgi:hypothetical protein
MDPDQALRDLRGALTALRRALDDDTDDVADHASTALDLFTGLDHWLTAGGFLPADWQPTTHRPTRPTGRH